MTKRLVVTKEAVRQFVREAITNPSVGWDSSSSLENSPVTISSVVDPSAALVDPDNPNYKPSNRMELRASMSSLFDQISDDESQEFFDLMQDTLKKVQEEEKMDKKTEALLRNQVKKMLKEAWGSGGSGFKKRGPAPVLAPVTGPMPEPKKIPFGVSGRKVTAPIKQSVNKADVQKFFDDVDASEAEAARKLRRAFLESASKNLPTEDQLVTYWKIYDDVYYAMREEEDFAEFDDATLYQNVPETKTFAKVFKRNFGKNYNDYMRELGQEILRLLTEGRNLSVKRDFDPTAEPEGEAQTAAPPTRQQMAQRLKYSSVSLYTNHEFVMLARWLMQIVHPVVAKKVDALRALESGEENVEVSD